MLLCNRKRVLRTFPGNAYFDIAMIRMNHNETRMDTPKLKDVDIPANVGASPAPKIATSRQNRSIERKIDLSPLSSSVTPLRISGFAGVLLPFPGAAKAATANQPEKPAILEATRS